MAGSSGRVFPQMLFIIAFWTIIVLGQASSMFSLDAPPITPNFKKYFEKSLKTHMGQLIFDKLQLENTMRENCNCHHYLFDRDYVSYLTSNQDIIPEDNCVITTEAPTTTEEATTSTTVEATTSTTPSTTTSSTKASTSSTSSPASTTNKIVVPKVSSSQPSLPTPALTSSSPVDVTSSPENATVAAPETPAPVVDKGGIDDTTIIIIGVCAGVIVVIFIAAIFAACRRCCASLGVPQRREKILRQRSDCERITREISVSDTSSSQPSSPTKEFINGYSKGPHFNEEVVVIGTEWNRSTPNDYDKPNGKPFVPNGDAKSRPNSGYINNDVSTESDFHFNTLKALDHPHALHFGGFGESSTDKTLPKSLRKKSKKEKEKEKSLKRKSKNKFTPSQEFAMHPPIYANEESRNRLDPNGNSLKNGGKPNGGLTTDTMCSKKDVGMITYENEVMLDSEKAKYSPSKSSRSLSGSTGRSADGESIGRWSGTDKSAGPYINDDLISDKNVDLFAYENPVMLSFKPDHIAGSSDAQSTDGAIPPPSEFQDSAQRIPKCNISNASVPVSHLDDPEPSVTSDVPSLMIEPSVAVIQRRAQRPSSPTDPSHEDGPSPRLSVKQRASLFEAQAPRDQRRASAPGGKSWPSSAPSVPRKTSADPRYIIGRSDIAPAVNNRAKSFAHVNPERTVL